jgi:hypothetical protein
MADEKKEQPEKVDKAVKKEEPLIDLAQLGQKISPWELAGLMMFARWKPGKHVTEKEFNTNLEKFRKRPQGGGRMKK